MFISSYPSSTGNTTLLPLSLIPPPLTMYTHNNTTFSHATVDPLGHNFPTTASLMHSSSCNLQQGQFALSELDSVWQLNSEVTSNIINNNNFSYCNSGSNSSFVGSPSSLASCETQRSGSCLLQRSISSQSLVYKNNNYNNNNTNGVHHHYPFSTLFAELLHSRTALVRRVYSTGDLQRINGMQHNHQSDSPLSSESSMIIEAMNRASPYSPEEKKVRIERYRSKRNQRNFNKKIKYACRKTLADSRPRIRGRFARNDEIPMMNPPVQWSQFGELEDEDDENWANFFDSLDPSNLADEPQDSSSFGFY